MHKPIFYWVSDSSRIYLLGNPVVWFGSTAAVLYALWLLIRKRGDRLLVVLLGAYALNVFPFAAIGRVMFLYHYFTALIFAVLIGAWLVDRLARPARAALALTLLAVIMFIYAAPLSYGRPLPQASFERRLWLAPWR